MQEPVLLAFYTTLAKSKGFCQSSICIYFLYDTIHDCICIIFALIVIFSSLAIAENACHNSNVSRIAVVNEGEIAYSYLINWIKPNYSVIKRRSNEAEWVLAIIYSPGGVRKNE